MNIYSLWIRSLLMEVDSSGYSQYKDHDISWTLRQCVSLDDHKDVCLGKL